LYFSRFFAGQDPGQEAVEINILDDQDRVKLVVIEKPFYYERYALGQSAAG
jgi:hypothetical protein